MKKNVKFWTLFALCTASISGPLAHAESEPVNFEKVNPVIRALIAQVIAGDSLVENVVPQFNLKESSLKEEKLNYLLVGNIKNVPWMKGPETIIQTTTVFHSIHDLASPGVEVNMKSEVDTDALAFYRYSAKIALEKNTGLTPKFASRISGLLHRMESVDTTTKLYDILIESQLLALEILDDKIQTETDPTETKEWLKVRSAYTALKMEKKVTDQGSTIRLWTNRPEGFLTRRGTAIVGREVTLELSARSISSSLIVFAPLAESKLERLKQNLTKDLSGLENGEASSVDKATAAFRSALRNFKAVIQGNNEY